MDSRLSGRVTEVREGQAEKADVPMLCSPSGKVILVRESHMKKASFPILCSPSGRVTEAREVHSRKAESPMRFSPSGRVTEEVNAIGAGGDFFLFHPLKLVNGSFFSGSDLMQDKIIVDEDVAWQLFGSNDIVGQQVTIEGVPYLISGVIERESGRLNDFAGNGSSIVYVSYETLHKNLMAKGQIANINHYEVVMPNPVKDFAFGIVKEKIGIS